MGGLGHADEQFECLLRGAVMLGHEDALGLLDGSTGFHRAPHVPGEAGLVEMGVGGGDGGVPGEGPGRLDGARVEDGKLGGVDVKSARRRPRSGSAVGRLERMPASGATVTVVPLPDIARGSSRRVLSVPAWMMAGVRFRLATATPSSAAASSE